MKRILLTVTNDLTHDQRMDRICTTLQQAGYQVVLIGVLQKKSIALSAKGYEQVRLKVPFKSGFLFYAWYNILLFLYLIRQRAHIICAIDLDTIIPCYYASKLKKAIRVYDAHELFTEMKEVVTRPRIKAFWNWVERNYVPHFKNGYTVGSCIKNIFFDKYGVSYTVVRNVPVAVEISETVKRENFILYQGAVNEARGLEYLIPAIQQIAVPLIICGDGNFMEKLKAMVMARNLSNKIHIKGMLPPAQLNSYTLQAKVGLNLVENNGLSNYYSLANKFFDYIHAGLPQVTMNFPEYASINKKYEVAVLINDCTEEEIIKGINKLLLDDVLYKKLERNCRLAAKELNWQAESKKLLACYEQICS